MKLLLIGNSYTYYNDMPCLLEALLRDNGCDAQVFSVTRGGRKLVENLNPQDEYALRLEELLREHSFDCVILQDQSLISILDYNRFEAGVTGLAEKLAPYTKKFILYATWGRKDGSPDLESHGLTRLTMTEQISAAYRRAAEQIGAAVSPVGEAFAALCGEVELYDPDLSHPSYAGSCLAAVTHYTTLMGKPPESVSSLALDPHIAAAMVNTAARLCGNQKREDAP